MKTGVKARFAGIAVLGVGLVACGSGRTLLREADAIEDRIRDQRIEDDALRCAPGPLARADAQLHFLRAGVRRGDGRRAAEHREALIEELERMEALIDECPPRDTDGDGVPDPDDACPKTPGLVGLAGCPDADADGIADPNDACPDDPEDIDDYEDDDGCPEDQDTDGDGVLNDDDRCPTEPGLPEDQGCPNRDTDGDGIVDTLDLCPEEPETKNGYRDDDGCPDRKLSLVVLDLEKGKIDIKQKVYFATGKSRIRSRSYRLLNEVAQLLQDNPDLKVLVEGHTDSRGSRRTNQRLSKARARSVRTYLIRRGVDPDRLTAQGFGEEEPIASNASRSGREKNRRVEFTIVGR